MTCGTNDAEIDALLNRAAAGDEVARDELLMMNRQRLKRMVAIRLDRRLLSRVDPSDVVQEALLEASVRLPDYLQRRPLPFFPWLRCIAWQRLTRAVEQHLRAQRRSVCREHAWIPLLSDDSVVELTELLSGSESTPSEHAVRRELQLGVRETLKELPKHDHEVLVMWYLERMSVAEIAATLELTERGVRSRHRRALQKLGQLLRRGGL